MSGLAYGDVAYWHLADNRGVAAIFPLLTRNGHYVSFADIRNANPQIYI